MGETRWRRLLDEVWKYLAVGLGATIVAIVLFNFLVHGYNTGGFAPMNSQPELAYLLANAVGMLISYRGTRFFAFSQREPRHSDGGRTAFIVINLATLLIPMTCLWISRNLMGLDDPVSDNISANVIGLLLANAARFVLFRQFVFPRPEKVAAD